MAQPEAAQGLRGSLDPDAYKLCYFLIYYLNIHSMTDEWKDAQQVGAYITIPFALAIPPVIGWLIGKYLDSYFGTSPWLMFVFIVIGFVAGGREVYRIIKRFGDE